MMLIIASVGILHVEELEESHTTSFISEKPQKYSLGPVTLTEIHG